MGFFYRLLGRRLTQDGFAKLVVKRLRASGETGPIKYDQEQFRLYVPEGNSFFLHNFFREYQRVSGSDREQVLRTFLTSWHTTGVKAPDDFNDAKADLLPVLRARAYLEIDLHKLAEGGQSNLAIPHVVVAEHLVAALVYDLPSSTRSVNDEELDKWCVTFYEAMEVAKQNLLETTSQYAQVGSVYAMVNGDAYDATRMLLTDLIGNLEVDGDTIAMVPNRESLFVCGSEDDEGLETMLKLVQEGLQHERFITGLAFRLVDDEWATWLPDESHPLYQQFNTLRVQSFGQTYTEQKELLEKRHQANHVDVFVASYSAIRNEESGRVRSYCTWTEGVDSLLPESDFVMLGRLNVPDDQFIAAQGDWETVHRVAGELMEPQGMYPERWRVRQFPTEEMLEKIGKAEL